MIESARGCRQLIRSLNSGHSFLLYGRELIEFVALTLLLGVWPFLWFLLKSHILLLLRLFLISTLYSRNSRSHISWIWPVWLWTSYHLTETLVSYTAINELLQVSFGINLTTLEGLEQSLDILILLEWIKDDGLVLNGFYLFVFIV